MVAAARARWPSRDIACRDVISDPLPERSVDFVIMNGVLTEKQTLSHEAMVAIAQELVVAAFKVARVGIAFNAMSRHVDWQRPELFHWGFDELSASSRAREPPLCLPVGLRPVRAHHVRVADAAASTANGRWLVDGVSAGWWCSAPQIAEVCAFYFDHDSDYEVVAFTVDGEFLDVETFGDGRSFHTGDRQTHPDSHELFIAVSYQNMNRVRAESCDSARAMGYTLARYVSSKAVTCRRCPSATTRS